MKDNYEFIWSDNWYIEEDKAWFVEGERNILFCMDLQSDECEYVAEIPTLNSETSKFRQNPRCIKIENEIFCIPDIGECVWVYNLLDSQFRQIEIENPNRERLSMTGVWKYCAKIFVLSVGLKKIIEIDVGKKVIDNFYTLCDMPGEEIAKYVRVESDIYCVSAVSNQIYQFNLETKKITIYTLPNVKGGLYAIGYDGNRFWLSGNRKEIYIWDKKNNSTQILSKFPEQFGIYNFGGDGEKVLDCESIVYDTPTFIDIKAVGQYIWLIPFQTNKVIYVDKDSCQIYSLELNEEEETKESLSKNCMSAKFLVEYILDNRYIGVFSFKNNCIFEIDTLERRKVTKVYTFNNDYRQKMSGRSFSDKSKFDRMLFKHILLINVKNAEQDDDKRNLNKKNIVSEIVEGAVGKAIYSQVN